MAPLTPTRPYPKCAQRTTGGECPLPGFYRYTWPGRDEEIVCASHARELRNIASAIGLGLQLVPLD
jgi:hypothetical protein